MGKLKFCANISWLYKDVPVLDRYKAAANDGFCGVEAGFLYDHSLPELVKSKKSAGIEQVLINSGTAKTLGSAGNSTNPRLFRDELELAIKYANALECKKVHIMAGMIPESLNKEQAQSTFVENLKFAADELQSHGIVGLIEPLNSHSFPRYIFNTSDEAITILQLVGKENIKYQLDFYHLQLMEGNLTQKIKNNFEQIGHIQISQVPKRNEPFSPGEIEYSYIFDLLEELGYDKWIGCEYAPSHSTDKSIMWFKDYIAK